MRDELRIMRAKLSQQADEIERLQAEREVNAKVTTMVYAEKNALARELSGITAAMIRCEMVGSLPAELKLYLDDRRASPTDTGEPT